MDWAAWQAEFPMTTERQRDRIEFQNLDPDSVWSKSEEEITEYLDWFQETQLNPQGRDGKLPTRQWKGMANKLQKPTSSAYFPL